MRKTVLTFRDALGLYWQDRYKPLFESLINIVASLILVKYFGIVGVFVGTFLSTILTCFCIEPYILFKYGITQKVKEYFKVVVEYSVITIIMAIITYLIANLINTSIPIITFIIKILLCLIIPNACYILLFRKKEEYKYFINLIINILYKIRKKGKKE